MTLIDHIVISTLSHLMVAPYFELNQPCKKCSNIMDIESNMGYLGLKVNFDLRYLSIVTVL